MRSINFDKLTGTGGAPRIRPSKPMAAVAPPDTMPDGSLTGIPQASDSLTSMPQADGSLTSLPAATDQPPRK